MRLRPGLLLLTGLAGACDVPPELISEREDFRLKMPGVTAPLIYPEW